MSTVSKFLFAFSFIIIPYGCYNHNGWVISLGLVMWTISLKWLPVAPPNIPKFYDAVVAITSNRQRHNEEFNVTVFNVPVGISQEKVQEMVKTLYPTGLPFSMINIMFRHMRFHTLNQLYSNKCATSLRN